MSLWVLSELITCCETDVTRFAIDGRTFNVGVVGFIKQVIDIAMNGEVFRDLLFCFIRNTARVVVRRLFIQSEFRPTSELLPMS